MAAYQGKGKRTVDHHIKRVVAFIGGRGGIRDPTIKRLTIYGEWKTVCQVSVNVKWLVRISYPTSQRLIQRQCELQEATDEHFFVQQETCLALCGAKIKRLWRTQRDFILRNFWSRSEFYAGNSCRLISRGRLDEDFLRSFAVFCRRGSSKTTGNGRTTEFNAEVATEKV